MAKLGPTVSRTLRRFEDESARRGAFLGSVLYATLKSENTIRHVRHSNVCGICSQLDIGMERKRAREELGTFVSFFSEHCCCGDGGP